MANYDEEWLRQIRRTMIQKAIPDVDIEGVEGDERMEWLTHVWRLLRFILQSSINIRRQCKNTFALDNIGFDSDELYWRCAKKSCLLFHMVCILCLIILRMK